MAKAQAIKEYRAGGVCGLLARISSDLKMKLNLMGFFLEKNIILFYVLGLIQVNGTNKQCMLDTFLALPTLPYRPRIRLW